MSNTNNLISIKQWNELIKAVSKNRIDTKQPTDTMYVGSEQLDRNKVNETRYFCYDNYDRYTSPGFDLIISNIIDMLQIFFVVGVSRSDL